MARRRRVSYAPYLVERIHGVPVTRSRSHRLVDVLRTVLPAVQVRRFSKTVLDAIFADALEQEGWSEERLKTVRQRATSRFGARRAQQLLIVHSEILGAWRERHRFVPDAFLIDPEHRLVVCYEVEDSHPLNANSLMAYCNAWWTLEYIDWDLRLVAYDSYGHPRTINRFSTGFLLQAEFDRRDARRAEEPVDPSWDSLPIA